MVSVAVAAAGPWRDQSAVRGEVRQDTGTLDQERNQLQLPEAAAGYLRPDSLSIGPGWQGVCWQERPDPASSPTTAMVTASAAPVSEGRPDPRIAAVAALEVHAACLRFRGQGSGDTFRPACSQTTKPRGTAPKLNLSPHFKWNGEAALERAYNMPRATKERVRVLKRATRSGCESEEVKGHRSMMPHVHDHTPWPSLLPALALPSLCTVRAPESGRRWLRPTPLRPNPTVKVTTPWLSSVLSPIQFRQEVVRRNIDGPSFC